jgi:hypothetical protein
VVVVVTAADSVCWPASARGAAHPPPALQNRSARGALVVDALCARMVACNRLAIRAVPRALRSRTDSPAADRLYTLGVADSVHRKRILNGIAALTNADDTPQRPHCSASSLRTKLSLFAVFRLHGRASTNSRRIRRISDGACVCLARSICDAVLSCGPQCHCLRVYCNVDLNT